MTKAELISFARIVLDDTVEPYLWSDTELTQYLQEAEMEAAERGKLLIEEDTTAYCEIDLVDGTAVYDLDSLVFDVDKARVDGQAGYLSRTSCERLDEERPGWEDYEGTPTHYYLIGSKIRVVPTPATDGTLDMVVFRHPTNPMGTSPEIPARHHYRLLDWVGFRAYNKRDADTYDPVKAKGFEKAFEESFGRRWSAEMQERRLKRTPRFMRDDS